MSSFGDHDCDRRLRVLLPTRRRPCSALVSDLRAVNARLAELESLQVEREALAAWLVAHDLEALE